MGNDNISLIGERGSKQGGVAVWFAPHNNTIGLDTFNRDGTVQCRNITLESAIELRDVLNAVIDEAENHKAAIPPPVGKASSVTYGDWTYWFNAEIRVPQGVDYARWLYENAVHVFNPEGEVVK